MNKVVFFYFVVLQSMFILAQKNIATKNEIGLYELNESGASYFANLSLDCAKNDLEHYIYRLYPQVKKLDTEQNYRVYPSLTNLKNQPSPKDVWPSFYGCFDWHSSVHNHWCLIKLLKNFPNIPEAQEIKNKLSQSFDVRNLKVELEFLQNGNEFGYFEFPYGQSWMLKIADELKSWNNENAKIWLNNLKPLLDHIEKTHLKYWSTMYPETLVYGSHESPSMGLSFAYDYAVSFDRNDLKKLIEKTAKKYYLDYGYYDLRLEPIDYDFMSGGLLTIDLMRKILSKNKLIKWINSFSPELLDIDKAEEVLMIKKEDTHDGMAAHWDGFHLNRIWCLNGLMKSLDNKLNNDLEQLWIKKMNAMWDYAQLSIGKGNYDIDHWLSSFSVFALMGYED